MCFRSFFFLIILIILSSVAHAEFPSARELSKMDPGRAVRILADGIRKEVPEAYGTFDEAIVLKAREIGGDEESLLFLSSATDRLAALIGHNDLTIRNRSESLLKTMVNHLSPHIAGENKVRGERALSILKRIRGWMEELGGATAERSAKRMIVMIDGYLPDSEKEALEEESMEQGLGKIVTQEGKRRKEALVLLGIVSRGFSQKSPVIKKSSLEMAQRIAPTIRWALREGGTLPRKQAEDVYQAIRRYLGDTEPSIRFLAAKAAGALADQGMSTQLIRLLRDRDESIRNEALAALRTISGKDYGMNLTKWSDWSKGYN